MPNLWNKKNPWLSLWLSEANRSLGSARVMMLRQTRRHNEAFMRASRRQAAAFWLGEHARRRKRSSP